MSLRHCQSSICVSMPRLSVMFDHFIWPGNFWMIDLPLASEASCETTSLSLVRPVHSLKYPAASAPPRFSWK